MTYPKPFPDKPYWVIEKQKVGRDMITIHAFYHKNARERITFRLHTGQEKTESVIFALLISSGSGNELHHSQHRTMKEVHSRLRALTRVMKQIECTTPTSLSQIGTK